MTNRTNFPFGMQLVLDRKVSGLKSSIGSSNVIQLDFEKYNDYLVQTPRNYSVVLMLTAMAKSRGCHHCQSAAEEFFMLINAFYQSKADKTRIFFAVVDFDDDPRIFASLNQNTVPVFMHFPPNSKPQKADSYDVSRNGLNAEALGQWIASRTGIHFKIERPPSYSGWFFVAVTACVTGIIIYLRTDSLQNIFNRSTVSYTTMIIIFYMVSGQMWNGIRHPPAFQNSAEGGLVIFYPSSNSQFVWETGIVMAVYALVSWSLVLLIEVTNAPDPNRKRVMAITGIALFAIFVSLSLSLFRKKNHGYPYSFLLK
nr:magnesium transporter protein [Hymenolepis microstoma]